jgi:hypothetical protein
VLSFKSYFIIICKYAYVILCIGTFNSQDGLNFRGFEPVTYRGVLVSALLHVIVYVFLCNLLNVLVQIANNMVLQKKSMVIAIAYELDN